MIQYLCFVLVPLSISCACKNVSVSEIGDSALTTELQQGILYRKLMLQDHSFDFLEHIMFGISQGQFSCCLVT
jgi:hypothetical protein